MSLIIHHSQSRRLCTSCHLQHVTLLVRACFHAIDAVQAAAAGNLPQCNVHAVGRRMFSGVACIVIIENHYLPHSDRHGTKIDKKRNVEKKETKFEHVSQKKQLNLHYLARTSVNCMKLALFAKKV